MKTQSQIMRELMDQLSEGHWGWDPPDFFDDEPEESEEEAAEREEQERAERRKEAYGDNDESDFDYDRDYKLYELPSYEKMKAENEFYFEERNVVSLEGAPDHVKSFVFERNKVSSLAHSPRIVDYLFDCSKNALTSFEGGPDKVGNFICKGNALTSLKGSPSVITNVFSVECASLKSYEGAPKDIASNGRVMVPLLVSDFREFTKHFPKLGEYLYFHFNRVQPKHMTNVLSIFNTGVKVIAFDKGAFPSKELKAGFDIVNTFLPMGKKGMMKCQLELIKAGLKEWAKL